MLLRLAVLFEVFAGQEFSFCADLSYKMPTGAEVIPVEPIIARPQPPGPGGWGGGGGRWLQIGRKETHGGINHFPPGELLFERLGRNTALACKFRVKEHETKASKIGSWGVIGSGTTD